ncbi:Hsp70 family protein [Streptomyces sp. 5-8]|uniref:Hsp70 family protein n=1 Tax=Streptomyces musisoli TaxID=2802280 RepID=A0ABS1P2X2_9ACTN|nr:MULTISPECIES: Hsp70 family protein [Streptomyces]MBL1106619.1 Hsp70 family protein [Streptomyces musisoli]MBY8840585.1 Hsp70 family protein [Streptomyces sp. SP2-10]
MSDGTTSETAGRPHGVVYGIDFGTWTSALVVLRQGHPPLPVRDPVSAHGATSVRSAVCLLPDGSMVVGQAAQNARLRRPEHFRAEFKREFGEPFPHRLGERRFTSEELTARVLGFLVAQARRAVGAEPDRVGISVPATWERARRGLMVDAAEAAGLPRETVEVHTEPVAAAVHALHDHGMDRERTILVYDLGGGTFDLAIGRGTRDGLTVLGSPGGLPHVGGLAIDQVVLGLIRARCPAALDSVRSSDPGADVLRRRTQLAEVCTAFKQQLSVSSEHTDLLTMLDPPVEVTVSQAELREAIRPLLSDTVAECERVLRAHGLGWADLDLIVPVGGSSRLPMVGELLAARSGRPVMDVSEPELAVAKGAAWLAWDAVRARVADPPSLPDAPPEQPRPGRTFPAGVRALLDAGLTDRLVLQAVRRART